MKFSPKEFMGLVEIAIEAGYENVHDLVLEAADQMAEEKPPSNVVPFPADEVRNHGQQDG
ncbi:MAG: hypothetical protein JWO89_1206 [Verrucomicrobiaceae bacterium]|nr:hypothetical protein [Verrucomicrobiaceae bacterium]